MPALFIGRFQPFHLGHLQVVEKAIKENDYLIIGIGSAENNFQPENPFTASERLQMIKNVLDYEKISPTKYCLIPARNIGDYSLWVRHIELLMPPFNKVYTGSPLVKKLFEEGGNHKVIDVEKKLKISATLVRDRMLENKNWEKLVHPEISKFIKKIKGIERIQAIYGSLPFA